MKQTVTRTHFTQTILADEYNDMTQQGAEALYDFLLLLEQDQDEEIEFDPVAIRCEWTEYKDEQEALNDTGMESIQDLHDHTIIIFVPNTNSIIINTNF